MIGYISPNPILKHQIKCASSNFIFCWPCISI